MVAPAQHWQERYGLSSIAAETLDAGLAALGPQPELVQRLETLLGRANDAGIAPAWLDAPHAAQAVVRLGHAAPFLLRYLAGRPAALGEGVLASLDGAGPLQPWSAYAVPEQVPGLEEGELLRLLRLWKYDCYVRLTARELLGLQSTAETCRFLSDLADGLTRVAVGYAFTQAVARHGLPLRADGSLAVGAVVGMGKLGGRELNFASDIDLIFIQDGDDTPCRMLEAAPAFPIHPEGGPILGPGHPQGDYWEQWKAVAAQASDRPEGRGTSGEFYNRLARQVIRLLAHPTAEGFGFRVDVDLRPQGRSGLLAPNVAYLEHYYLEQGREWERTAMLKARVLAGEPALAQRFAELIRPFVFRRYLDYGALEGIAIVKHDINRFNRSAMEHNLKLGRGGIRENEFFVQALQLLYGGRKPQVQVTSHAEAVGRLVQAGVLAEDEAGRILDDYWLMRRMENRIQMVEEAQTQELPSAEAERLRIFHDFAPDFAERLPAAEAALEAARARTAERFAQLFAGMAEEGYLDPQTWRDAVRARVAPARQESVIERVDSLFARLMRTRAGERCVFKLGKLLTQPELYQRGTEEALTHWLEFFEQIGNRSALYALIEAHPPIVAWVSRIFCEGGRHARVLVRHPEFMESFFSIAEQWEGSASRFADVFEHARDEEEFILELQTAKEQSLMRVLTAYLNQEQWGGHLAMLSDLADATVSACTEFAWRRTVGRLGVPAGATAEQVTGYAVFALGKLGSREMRFGSDLDLLFLYREEGTTSQGRSHYEFYTKLTQLIGSLLTSQTMFGRLYDLDHRLRPFGNKGLLVPSLGAFQSFLQPDAQAGADVWNFQALTRIRPVCGDRALASEALAAIAPAWQRRGLGRAQVVEKVRDMLGRLVAQYAPVARDERPALQLKYAVGGLIGYEFVQQAHFLCARLEGAPDWTAPPGHAMIEPLAPDYQSLSALDERLSFYVQPYNHEVRPAQLRRLAALSAHWRFEAVEGLCRRMEDQIERAFRALAG